MSKEITINKREFLLYPNKYLKDFDKVTVTNRGVIDFYVIKANVTTLKEMNVTTSQNKDENVTTLQHPDLSKKRFKATIKVDEQIKQDLIEVIKEESTSPLPLKVDRIPKTFNSLTYGCGCTKSEKYLCGKHGRI